MHRPNAHRGLGLRRQLLAPPPDPPQPQHFDGIRRIPVPDRSVLDGAVENKEDDDDDDDNLKILKLSKEHRLFTPLDAPYFPEGTPLQPHQHPSALQQQNIQGPYASLPAENVGSGLLPPHGYTVPPRYIPLSQPPAPQPPAPQEAQNPLQGQLISLVSELQAQRARDLSNQEALLEVLRDANASRDADRKYLKDKDNRSVAELARMNGQEAAARWLEEHMEPEQLGGYELSQTP